MSYIYTVYMILYNIYVHNSNYHKMPYKHVYICMVDYLFHRPFLEQLYHPLVIT